MHNVTFTHVNKSLYHHNPYQTIWVNFCTFLVSIKSHVFSSMLVISYFSISNYPRIISACHLLPFYQHFPWIISNCHLLLLYLQLYANYFACHLLPFYHYAYQRIISARHLLQQLLSQISEINVNLSFLQ